MFRVKTAFLPEEGQEFFENVKSSSWNPFRLTVKKKKERVLIVRDGWGKKVEIADPNNVRAKIPRISYRPFDIGR